MQKADFEKNVQQKMQELRFRPSDEVWKRVEAGISTGKRRRPVVLWLLFAGLMLAVGSYYFISRQSGENIAGNNPAQPGQSIAEKQTKKDQQSNESAQPRTTDPSAASEINQAQRISQHSLATQLKNEKERKNSLRDQSGPIPSKNKTEQVLSGEDELSIQDLTHSGNLFSTERDLRFASPLQPNWVNVNSPFGDQQLNNRSPLSDALVVSEAPPTAKKETSQSLKKSNWQFGIAASGGISDLGEQLFQSAAASGLYYDPLQSAGSGGISRKPSEVKNGASFSLGVYASRTLAKKWKLGMGVGYQYFSNTIKVGEKVDSVVIINQNSFAMDRVSEYYKSAGNSTYHNQYHFISIPVFVQWQFAKKFTWENGLVASKMIKTNALHYDGVSGRYYEDAQLFNDFQLSATTAVLFGLNKNKIQIGPQFQYAFTNLLINSTGNAKHLRSVSIKASVELWKN